MMRRAQKLSGFTLIELTIVLGIVGLMVGGMWRMMSGNNAQMRDQVTAVHHKQIVDAVLSYLLTDEGLQYMASLNPGEVREMTLPTVAAPADGVTNGACAASVVMSLPAAPVSTHKGLCAYLPNGFHTSTTNPYGQTYRVGIKKDASDVNERPKSFSFMVVTRDGEAISDTSGGRISSAIGADGGFIYSDTSPLAVGSYGTWQTSIGAYALLAPYTNPQMAGHVASLTRYAPGHSFSFNWLSRNKIPGDLNNDQNTMNTTLKMADTTEISLGSAASIQGMGVAGSIVSMDPFIDLKSNYYKMSNALINLSATKDCIADGAACTNYAINISQGDIELNDGVMHSLTFAYATSDIRLKKDIKHLDGALDNIMKLNPVSFTYIKTNKPSMGVIAQELEKIYPQLVMTGGKEGMKSVAYEGLIAPLVGAVQELKKANDDLIIKQQEMQKEIDALKQAK